MTSPADTREIKDMRLNFMLVFCLNLLLSLLAERTVSKRREMMASLTKEEMEMGVALAKIIFLQIVKGAIDSCKIEILLFQ